MKGAIVVSGSIAQRAGYGGHAWALLQWVLGFRQLGWKVLFLDRLEPGMAGSGDSVDDPAGASIVAGFDGLMRRFGLEDDYALLLPGGRTAGLTRAAIAARIAEADLLINIMGFLSDPELMGAARHRVFLDIDPGFGQMWRALGQHDLFAGHDDFVTLGLNIGDPGCRIPTCGLPWIPTLHPIVLDLWPAVDNVGNAFTSIGAWRGPWASVRFEGESFGLRCHEFRRFFELPAQTGFSFAIALDIDRAETDDLRKLRAGGWELVDPRRTVPDVDGYRAFIAHSAAEFMIAKNMYVRSHSGWFSDRSISYLACGRPVLAQDTGLQHHLPSGEGLVLFNSIEEAVAGANVIQSRLRTHSRAARELAVTVFDSDVVLQRLVDRLGTSRGLAA